jgi:hypothetical protein
MHIKPHYLRLNLTYCDKKMMNKCTLDIVKIHYKCEDKKALVAYED